MAVVYDYDELGRPIVTDMYYDNEGKLRNLRTFPINPNIHDWGLGELRVIRRRDYRLVKILRLVYRLGVYYGLPSYVVRTAALIARKKVSKIKYIRYDKYELVATALLKLAAKTFGMRFKAKDHRKGLLKIIRKLNGDAS